MFENCEVIGTVHSQKLGADVPILGITWMSDEEWQRLAEEGAVENYIRENDHEPESLEEAFRWQREWLDNKEVI